MMAARVFEPENPKTADENAMIKLSGSSRRTRAQRQARDFAGQYLSMPFAAALRPAPTRGQAGQRQSAAQGQAPPKRRAANPDRCARHSHPRLRWHEGLARVGLAKKDK